MDGPIFSPQELHIMAQIATTIKTANEQNEDQIPGYFTWGYYRYGELAAEQSGDFPDLIAFKEVDGDES